MYCHIYNEGHWIYHKYEKHFPKMYRNVGMAVPKTTQTRYMDGSVQATQRTTQKKPSLHLNGIAISVQQLLWPCWGMLSVRWQDQLNSHWFMQVWSVCSYPFQKPVVVVLLVSVWEQVQVGTKALLYFSSVVTKFGILWCWEHHVMTDYLCGTEWQQPTSHGFATLSKHR